MASIRMAEVFDWQPLSKNLAIFRLKRCNGEPFPDYKAGQNIELIREDTRMIFSIASAPYQTRRDGYLEFFVHHDSSLGPGTVLQHASAPVGTFTLERARSFSSIIFVATGTGIAPFISMIRELTQSAPRNVYYTLIQGSRKFEELGYYKELSALASAATLDFLYVPTVSRPGSTDWDSRSVGKGRAGALLRRMLYLPYEGEAELPAPLTEKDFRHRFQPQSTIVMACGSHASVADIKKAALEKRLRFEKEDW